MTSPHLSITFGWVAPPGGLVFSTHPSLEDSKPGEGQWADGRYRNAFFGFHFQAPEKWKSVSLEELDRLGEGEGDGVSTEMENLVAAEVEKNPPVGLFQMMEIGADDEYTGQMLSLSAENIGDPVENDVDLFGCLRKSEDPEILYR